MQSVWILGDQLSPANSALVEAERRGHRVVLMIESKARGTYLRYHQQKLVLMYSAMRHFAEELRALGWEVDYYRFEETSTFEAGLRQHVAKYAPSSLLLAEPNDFLMADVVRKIGRKFRLNIEVLATTQFFVSREEFSMWAGKRHWLVMDSHYREMRKRTGYLIEADKKPTGGAWSYRAEGGDTFCDWEQAGKPRSWKPVREEPDHITRNVIALVEKEFPEHPGNARNFWFPVNRKGALRWLERFVKERLECFGRYERVMSSDEVVLFHAILSPALNIGLLSPEECCEAALMAFENGDAPLHSVERFIRQVLGWRDFINGVYWHRGPEYKTLNALGANRPIPQWFRTGESPLKCIHYTVRTALEHGWINHTQRLMVIGNFFLIAGVRPGEVLQWFLETMVDGEDWVVAANVIGIGLYADGGYVTAAPSAATATYISRNSDFCRSCQFRPNLKTGATACPFNFLFWNFIDKHAQRFSQNQRMERALQMWEAFSETERKAVRRAAQKFLEEYLPEKRL